MTAVRCSVMRTRLSAETVLAMRSTRIAQRGRTGQTEVHKLAVKLSGGDLRSIGRAEEVVREVLADPSLFEPLIMAISHAEPVVRARAADAAEKISQARPELLAPFRKHLLQLAAVAEQQEVRWHLAQMLPRLELTARQRGEAADILFGYLKDKSGIVRTFALQGLADLARRSPELLEAVLPELEAAVRSGTPAMRSRARKLLAEHVKGEGDR